MPSIIRVGREGGGGGQESAQCVYAYVVVFLKLLAQCLVALTFNAVCEVVRSCTVVVNSRTVLGQIYLFSQKQLRSSHWLSHY